MAPRAKVAAVQAAYVLMDQQATLAKAIALLQEAAAEGAQVVVYPEVFIPGTPIWFDSGRIWHGDEQWYAMLVDQAVVVPGPVTEKLSLSGMKSRVQRGRDQLRRMFEQCCDIALDARGKVTDFTPRGHTCRGCG